MRKVVKSRGHPLSRKSWTPTVPSDRTSSLSQPQAHVVEGLQNKVESVAKLGIPPEGLQKSIGQVPLFQGGSTIRSLPDTLPWTWRPSSANSILSGVFLIVIGASPDDGPAANHCFYAGEFPQVLQRISANDKDVGLFVELQGA